MALDIPQLIMDFDGPDKNIERTKFVVGFGLVNLIFIWFISTGYNILPLEKLQRYDVAIDSITCNNFSWEDDTDTMISVYEVSIYVGEYNFEIIGLNVQQCEKIQNRLRKTPQTSIWHDEGLVYQVSNQGDIMLPYAEHAPVIDSVLAPYKLFHYLLLILLWIFIPKTLVNLVKPGSYKIEE